MKKWFLILMMMFIVDCMPGSAEGRMIDASASAEHSSVSIQIGFSGQWQTIGTGVAIHKRGIGKIILTVKHVAADAPLNYRACAITEPSSCVLLNTFVTNSSDGLNNDWAVYFVDEFPDGVRAASRSNKLSTGASVMTLGYPDGTLWTSYGNASTYYTEGYWGLDLFARPGNSGGGVWDEDGHLVGLLCAVLIQDNLMGKEIETQQSLMVPLTQIPFL